MQICIIMDNNPITIISTPFSNLNLHSVKQYVLAECKRRGVPLCGVSFLAVDENQTLYGEIN